MARLLRLAVWGTLTTTIAAQDIGFEGPQFTGAGETPTESKPESKLWFNDGSWWGSLWSSSAQGFRIHRLDLATHRWIDTGVAIDSRSNSHGDVLWDGAKLYIASHEFSNTGGAAGNPIRILRYSYNALADLYSLDPGFPVAIGDFSTEALVIDKDSTGTLWAAWTQGLRVRISHTQGSDTTWSAPVVLPTNTTDLLVDDICSLIHFNGDRIGVLWSDQVAGAFRFSVHQDGAADTAWSSPESAASGPDDHMHLATDGAGRVLAAVKDAGDEILLLVRDAGGWHRFVAWQPAPIHTRPILLLDEQDRTIHLFSTGQETGEVFEKVSALDSISFPAGSGTIVMRDASAVFRISNPTSTKQNLSASTGLVVLAHHDTTGFYWHHDVAPESSDGPLANFTASPTSGQAPLTVQFTDVSSGNITSRQWSFGDGGTSSATNPSHTYAAGTFTVSLTVSGPNGSDTETRTDFIVVTPASGGPVADFTASPRSGQAPLTVQFSDASSGSITSRRWTFGDGGTSTAQNPSHTYAAGTFTVTLTVSGPNGSDTETKTSFITVSQPPPGDHVFLPPVPGVAGVSNVFTVVQATPGSVVSFYAGQVRGSTLVFSSTCGGAVPLQLARPFVLIGTSRANLLGVAVLTAFVPASTAGKVFYLQAVDQSVCQVSNLVTEQF